MCGIVGAAARRDVVPVLLEGLGKLEYRGYDSCGIAVVRDRTLHLARTVSRVGDLRLRINGTSGRIGVAHTRWATHGAPATENAHPIVSGNIAVVHNGIIENHEALRAELQARGYRFTSETDTEVISHLVHSLYQGELVQAVRRATQRLRGSYAIAVIARHEPRIVVGARSGSPLVVGIGEGEHYLASDALALTGVTERIVYLEEGDFVCIDAAGWRVTDGDGRPLAREVRTVKPGAFSAELGPYRHFMQKEIFEQPRAVAETLESIGGISPALFGATAQDLSKLEAVLILACGTSYHAGLVARQWIESLAGIPCDVEVASEYRYRASVPNPRALVVAISQSGETADTLAALAHAQALGHSASVAVCNVASSAIMRRTRFQFLTRAGAEIGVASTKAFTTQLVALLLLAMTLAVLRGRLDAAAAERNLTALRELPAALRAALALEPQLVAWAERLARREHALYLGRGVHYPIALEGALKLKEISYIHAEAHPAGELKHGPLALVTAQMPVVTLAPNDALLEKLKSNMNEVRARAGELYVCAAANTGIAPSSGVNVIRLPACHAAPLSPILHVVPLQLLAYHAALARGTDVDKPRNLAKSVTVE